jgi:hypothetical protein
MKWFTRTRGLFWGRLMPRLGSRSTVPVIIRVSLAMFALVLLYALTLAARSGLAYVYAAPARDFLQDKRDADITLLTETEWQAIHANLRQALSLSPNDPDILSELGHLHRIRLEQDALDAMAIEKHGNLAIDYYERAARLRPAWSWVWINLAHVRWELYQDSGDDYHQALIHAIHFGPWERGVQSWVVDLALDTWEFLSPDASHAVLAMIDRSLQRAPEVLDEIIDTEWQTLCGDASLAAAAEPDGSRADEFSRLQRHCEALTPADQDV